MGEREDDTMRLCVHQAVREAAPAVLTSLYDVSMEAVIKAAREVVCCDVAVVFGVDANHTCVPLEQLLNKDDAPRGIATAAKQGWTQGQAAVRAGEGLVGTCFKLGETISVPNCHADDRFDSSKDQRGGIQCLNMLCAPIVAPPRTGQKSGDIIGVFQLYNKTLGDGFDHFDERWADEF